MIHNWQCKRCTHEWQTSCFGEMTQKEEDHERNHRQLQSHLCWDCFEQLEIEEIAGLELFNLFFYLGRKYGRMYEKGRILNRYQKDGLWHDIRYSGMCHPYRSDVYGPDGNTIVEGNWDGGYTVEQNELSKIESEVQEAYENVILGQRTLKRIELDEFQKHSGYRLFGSQPRPENFVGDPPGKQRFEVICGVDLATGEFIPPTIQLSRSGRLDTDGK